MNTSIMIDQLIREETDRHQEELAVLYFLKFNKDLILTGSQLFGTQNEDSDYDFFINEDSVNREVYKTLESLGFIRNWNSDYGDDPTVRTVFEYSGGIEVHIQVIKSYWFDKKVAAQAKIQEWLSILPDSIRRLTKEQMKQVWRRGDIGIYAADF